MLDGSRQRLAGRMPWKLFAAEFAAREVRFKLKPGVRFYYKTIEFEGLKHFRREAQSYFVRRNAIRLPRNRVFSPSALKVRRRWRKYVRAGYQNAI